MAQAQKNFFAVVSFIACLLAFLPAEYIVISSFSHGALMSTVVSNIFGIIAGSVVLYGLFNRERTRVVAMTSGYGVLSCVVAAFCGWTMFESLIGGAFLTIVVFIAFVLSLIHYEDLGHGRKHIRGRKHC